MAKLKAASGFNDTLKSCDTDTSDSDSEEELTDVKSRRGVYNTKSLNTYKSMSNEQHPFAAYDRGPSSSSSPYIEHDLQHMFFNLGKVPDYVWHQLPCPV